MGVLSSGRGFYEREKCELCIRDRGMIPSETEGEWYYFDLVPEEYEIRKGQPDYTGKVCVIGAKLDEEALKKVFHK